MKFPVKIYVPRHRRRGHTTLSLLAKLMAALGLGPGKPAMAVVSPGVVIICQSEWVEVFEEILRDFPRAFICEAEAAPKSVSAPGATRIENGL
jgi:hypothetical protein